MLSGIWKESGRSKGRIASNETPKVQWTSEDPGEETQIDMALLKHHSRTDISETNKNVWVDAGFGTIVGIDAVSSGTGKVERSSKGPGKSLGTPWTRERHIDRNAISDVETSTVWNGLEWDDLNGDFYRF